MKRNIEHLELLRMSKEGANLPKPSRGRSHPLLFQAAHVVFFMKSSVFFLLQVGLPPVLYTDFLSMLRLNGRWWIIAKSSDGEPF